MPKSNTVEERKALLGITEDNDNHSLMAEPISRTVTILDNNENTRPIPIDLVPVELQRAIALSLNPISDHAARVALWYVEPKIAVTVDTLVEIACLLAVMNLSSFNTLDELMNKDQLRPLIAILKEKLGLKSNRWSDSVKSIFWRDKKEPIAFDPMTTKEITQWIEEQLINLITATLLNPEKSYHQQNQSTHAQLQPAQPVTLYNTYITELSCSEKGRNTITLRINAVRNLFDDYLHQKRCFSVIRDSENRLLLGPLKLIYSSRLFHLPCVFFTPLRSLSISENFFDTYPVDALVGITLRYSISAIQFENAFWKGALAFVIVLSLFTASVLAFYFSLSSEAARCNITFFLKTLFENASTPIMQCVNLPSNATLNGAVINTTWLHAICNNLSRACSSRSNFFTCIDNATLCFDVDYQAQESYGLSSTHMNVFSFLASLLCFSISLSVSALLFPIQCKNLSDSNKTRKNIALATQPPASFADSDNAKPTDGWRAAYYLPSFFRLQQRARDGLDQLVASAASTPISRREV